MRHFVGCSSQGFLYESREGDLELHPEYVGQVIADTEIVGVGAAMNEEGSSPHAQPLTTRTSLNRTALPGLRSASNPNSIARARAPGQFTFNPNTPSVPPVQQENWAPTNQGYYTSNPNSIAQYEGTYGYGGGYPGMMMTQPMMGMGGGMMPTPMVCPEYLAEACAVMDQGSWCAASGEFCEDEYYQAYHEQFATGGTVFPWCVCNEKQRLLADQKKNNSINAAAIRKANAKKNAAAAAAKAKNQGGRGSQSSGRGSNASSSNGRQGSNTGGTPEQQANRAALCAGQPMPYPCPGSAQCCLPQYCPPPQYAPQQPPPGYPPPGYPPQGYGPPQGQDDGGGYDCGGYDCGGYDCGGYDCGGYNCGDYGDDCDVQYAAGAAPSGLGSAIGGIAGGAIGMFAGSPEIGAPLGAALGGTIQGMACRGGNHNFGKGAGGQGGGMGLGGMLGGDGQGGMAGQDHATYSAGGKKIFLYGTNAPDGLFDPDNTDDPSKAPMAALVAAANDELRKLRPGNTWGGHHSVGEPTRPGAVMKVKPACAMKAKPAVTKTAVTGYFDLPRYADVVGDHIENAADWIMDHVSGPQQEERFLVSGSSGSTKQYGPYQAGTVQQLLSQLPSTGMSVQGANPYSIDTHSHGVELTATYDGNGYVTVGIKSKNFYVSQSQVWDKLDPLMPHADA